MFAPFRSAVTFKNTDVSKFPSQIKFQGKRSETLRVARQKHRRHFQIPQRLNPAGMKTISSSSSSKFFLTQSHNAQLLILESATGIYL